MKLQSEVRNCFHNHTKSWTRQKIMEAFKCSQYMARQAESLVKEKGVFSTPNPLLG